jgi:hypothetical protein
MTGMPWVKSYVSLLTNPRYGQLPDSARLHYREMLDLAGRLDAGGLFISEDGEQMSTGDIAYFLRTDPKILLGDIKILVKAKFINMNGRGPEIIDFMDTQGPSQETKHAQWCERQKKHRTKIKNVTGDILTVTGDIGTESESDKESESDRESEEESSVKETNQRATDDISLTHQKTEICKYAGIPPKYSSRLIARSEITPHDIMAELAYNFSRKGKVKNPGYITGMNLSNTPPEKPAAEWYCIESWEEQIPQALQSKLGFVFQRNSEGSEHLVDVATRIDKEEIRGSKVERKVSAFLRRKTV